MGNISRFETLTNRNVLIQKRTKGLISDLRRLVRLLEADIDMEEERLGISDPTNPDYSVSARKLGARRENLIATISRLEGTLVANIRNKEKRSTLPIT
jgi:hypothetical protein